MFINIIRKDIKLFFRDRKALILLILMPIILATILSVSLKGVFDQAKLNKKIKVGVVKEYKVLEDKKYENEFYSGEVSLDPEEIFFENFLEQKRVSELIEYEIIDKKEIDEKFKQESFAGVIVLPKDYYKKMKINFNTAYKSEIKLKLIKNDSLPIGSEILSQVLSGFNQRINTMLIAKNSFLEYGLKNDLDDFEKGIKSLIDNIVKNNDYKKIEYGKLNGLEPINSRSYYAIAMLSMFLLFTSGYASTLLLDEKNNKTFDRLLVAGKSFLTLLTSKAVLVFFISFFQIMIMIIYSSLILKVNWGTFDVLIVFSFFTSISIALLGLLFAIISLFTQNYKLTNALQGGVFQILAFFGGSYVPVEILPEIFAKIKMFLINGVITDGYLKIVMGYGYKEILRHINILVINSILFIIGIFIMKAMVKKYAKYY
ncbi:MAG: ABC transporter permease [Bacillota bacterium]